MSNGRLDLGIGSGYQQFEFERFGVDLKDSHALFAEFYDILHAGLRERIFSYDGKHLKIPPTAIARPHGAEADAADLGHLGKSGNARPRRSATITTCSSPRC